MTTAKKTGPVVIEFGDDVDQVDPGEAPLIVDDAVPQTNLQMAATLSARPPNRLVRWAFAFLGMFLSIVISLAAWDFVNSLLVRFPILGVAVSIILGIFLILIVVILLKEAVALARLSRIDRLQKKAANALADHDLKAARDVARILEKLYANRAELQWAIADFNAYGQEILDADGILSSAETTLLAPLDAAALRQVEGSARQVATMTALLPMAFADVITALTANLRMIRQIAEIYGGKSGTLGSWRLTRSVFAHLVATGAVAIGDDLIGSVAGGSVLSKLSRRFGEGVINGALTARVGVAAMEVCRPLAFTVTPRPSVAGIMKRSVTGLFSKE